jgi:C4-dicarboxylate-specific signal transduction histidine kinase
MIPQISSQEFRELAELLDIGLWKYNLVERRLEWDTSIYKRYEVDPTAFPSPGDFWRMCLTQESLARAEREMARVYAGALEYEATYEIRLPSGQIRHVLARATVIRDDKNRPSHMYGLNLDVTEHTRIEQENAKVVAQMQEAQAIARVGSWTFDLATQELAWSNELHKIYEISEEEPKTKLYQLYRSRVHPEDQARLDECVRRATETGEGYVLDYRLTLGDGRIKHVQGIGRVTFDENGKPARLGGTCRDRTQEAELQQLLDLERAKSVQRARMSSLGELSAGIAHEINNPLAVIDGSVELLLRRSGDARNVEERAETIRGASQRIAKIVRGLKSFSRPHDETVFASHALTAILQDALVLVEPKAKGRNTRILTDVKSDPRLYCDRLQVQQVLINLISNSIDAVQDRAEKWVKVAISDESGATVVRVIDSGPGISAEVRGKLFTPFFSTKRIDEGSGLGLTISKGILDAHGATIGLNTSFNYTCFEVRFRGGAASHGV